ncbi:MAG: hypothetical protein LDLANPLL_02287 [Turneriella sp.]|nr:hypothetical protein [Turneriella sp.]
MIVLRIFIISAIFIFPLAAKEKIVFDERGNIVKDAKGIEEKGIPSPQKNSSTPSVNPAESAPPKNENTPTDEEQAALSAQKRPLTKVYLENARLYLRSRDLNKALDFLKKSQEAGEDEFSREARLTSLYLRARRGDKNLDTEAETQEEASKAEALLRIADGYSACARITTVKNSCAEDAVRLYAYLGEWTPNSKEGVLSRLRLAAGLIEKGDFSSALPILTRTLLDEPQVGGEIPYDRAWFNLGELYEKPWLNHDAHKARTAYQQVLRYKESPYRQKALERIRYLERFGVGYAR